MKEKIFNKPKNKDAGFDRLRQKSSTVSDCKTFDSDVMRGGKVEPSSPSGAVDSDSRLHHSLLSSCYRPLTLSLQSQVVYISDMNKVIFVKVVISFQKDDSCVRGKVGVWLGDVVGKVVAYLVWRTWLLMTSCIISYDIVDIISTESSDWYSQQQQQTQVVLPSAEWPSCQSVKPMIDLQKLLAETSEAIKVCILEIKLAFSRWAANKWPTTQNAH